MNLFKIFLFTAAVLSFTLAAKITIIGPQNLADQFSDDIEYALSHFGNIPYGAHLVGQVFLTEPIDGCGGVEPFHEGENTYHENVIALVRRGDCRISNKIRNAQFAGAKVVLLVNINDDNYTADFFGHEDGTEDIKIPTLMIKASDGEKIIKTLEAINSGVSQPSEEATNVIMSISFPYDPKSEVVQLDFWYSTADTYKSSFIFLKRFYEQWKRNQPSIDFVPHFVTWTCGECKKQDFKVTDDPDCLSGGRYCAPDPDEGGKVTGADVVREDLRQACIYKQSPDLWWRYVIEFGDNCLGKEDIESCAKMILKTKAEPTQNTEIEYCMKSTFQSDSSSTPVNEKLHDNTLLREEKELQLEYSIHQFPVLFINHKPYYGKLQHAYLVFEEVCRNLEPLTDDCKIALSRTGENTEVIEQHHTGRVLVLILMMTILAVLVFFCCRRMIKSESKDMSLEVGGLVTKYFALRDSGEATKEEETTS